MIKFRIGSYEIMAFAGKNQPVRVYLNDDTRKYRGCVDFIPDYSGTQNFIIYPDGSLNAFMPLDKLHSTLDILRHERPVYFSVNQQYNWAAFKTGVESTGEEITRERSMIAQVEWA